MSTADTRPSILVIGDPSLRELLDLLAAKQQWRTDVSISMEDALAELSKRSYNVLITTPATRASEDLAFYARVRRAHSRIKLIALSFDGKKNDVIDAIREHAFSYFHVPFCPDSLMAMIANALAEDEWTDGIELLSTRLDWLSLRLSSTAVTAERVLQFMRELESDLRPADRDAIGAALREILLNAMEHGGQFDPGSKIVLSYVRTGRMILYHLRDPGTGFSLDHLPHSAVGNPEDKPFEHASYRSEHGIRPGGFGILMSRKLVDDLLYNEKGNEVLLVKYLSA